MIRKENNGMNIKTDLSAAILVGRSTRMGRDKALLVFNRQTFIDHLIRELSGCREVFISSVIKTDYPDYGLKTVPDEIPDFGPVEGIRQSLRHAETEHVFICANDMPFVRREMIEHLAEFVSADFDAWVFRDEERIHPLCGIYRRTVLPAAQQMIAEDRHRLMELLSRVRTRYVDISAGGFSRDALRNINTPEEYAELVASD
jgi:molybdopterin-guanine dinucleotide biosynthesis protein A